jgi:hypothetical protein
MLKREAVTVSILPLMNSSIDLLKKRLFSFEQQWTI